MGGAGDETTGDGDGFERLCFLRPAVSRTGDFAFVFAELCL